MTAVLSETGNAVSILGDGQFLVDLAVVNVKTLSDWQRICLIKVELRHLTDDDE